MKKILTVLLVVGLSCSSTPKKVDKQEKTKKVQNKKYHIIDPDTQEVIAKITAAHFMKMYYLAKNNAMVQIAERNSLVNIQFLKRDKDMTLILIRWYTPKGKLLKNLALLMKTEDISKFVCGDLL